MFGETNYARDMANTLEEREILEQMVFLGVGYTQSRFWCSKAAISDMHTLRRYVSRVCSLQKHSDVGSITQEAQKHIRNGDNGYYLLDLHKGCILVRGQYPIEDIIMDLAVSKNPDSFDHILIRWRKGNCFPDTRFFIAPNAVYFLWMDRTYQLNEFHMLSFISLGGVRSGFVVDYDARQNDQPLVLFPCKENEDIIQSQLDFDDHCRYESFTGNTIFD